MMERQVGHMVRLIDDLLDVSRITSGKIALQREPTPLGSLVHSAVEANRAALAAKHIELSVELPKDPCVIDVDPTRFVQILSNLLNNAAKFTNNGGSVCISATIAQPASDAPPQVSISVVDSGIGMSPELLPRVFDLFTQERHAPRNLDWESASRSHVDWWNFTPDVSTPEVKDTDGAASSSSNCHSRRLSQFPPPTGASMNNGSNGKF